MWIPVNRNLVCTVEYPYGDHSNSVTGPRPQTASLAGIRFSHAARRLLIVRIEMLKEHRQEFIHASEGMLSLPLLPDVARFFTGQVACSLVAPYVSACLPDRPPARTLATAMLSFSSSTSCK